jgi:hypothetical protein
MISVFLSNCADEGVGVVAVWKDVPLIARKRGGADESDDAGNCGSRELARRV